MSATIITDQCYDSTELRHYQPENNGQIVQLANWPFPRESPLVIKAEISVDPQVNLIPSQTHCVFCNIFLKRDWALNWPTRG